ncbi:hypothetical protein J5991_06725 [Methanocorpusculum sp.]|nr:hypothetical protein [Methanocorpusculum sp.]
MTNKTYRFATVVAVLMAFCLVFMMPVGATTAVSDYSELTAAISNGGDITLSNDIVASDSLIFDKDVTIDLMGHELRVDGDNKLNQAVDVTIQNGTLNLTGTVANGDAIFRIGSTYTPGKIANLTLSQLTVNGNVYSSAYAVFYLGGASKLTIVDSVFTLENEQSGDGGVIKSGACNGEYGIIDIQNTHMDFKDAGIGFLDGTVTLSNSELTIEGGKNAINQCALTIDNSKVTITNPAGRGITVKQGDVIIKGNSEVKITGSTEASIRYKDDSKTLCVKDSAKLSVETIVTDTIGETTPLSIDELGESFVVEGTGVSITVDNEVVVTPLPPQPSTSSSSGTPTPGAYYNYPRTVTDGGLVEFGTSKVVKSVTLPAGSSGKVNLHIDSTAYWPLALDSEFTFDISVDNLGEGTSYISFKIDESKLTALELTAADVGVYHEVNGEWVKLVVTYTIEDGDVIYTAETDSFSPFKLVIEEGAAVQKEEEVTPSEPVTPPVETPDVPEEPQEILPPIDTPETPSDEPESPAPILAVLAGLGAAVVLRRK